MINKKLKKRITKKEAFALLKSSDLLSLGMMADNVRKIYRLRTWCEDVNKTQSEVKYIPLYVKQEGWEKYRRSISKFDDVVKLFKMV